MNINKKAILLLALSCGLDLCAQNIQNPVLPGVADAGAVKYNGKYYIGGVFTNGDFYISKDLVNWGTPVHVVSMNNDWTKGSGAGDNQIHANDMFYLNGDFHLYWSVNYWGKDKHAVHIVHAQGKDILGPYTEPDKTTWMDNRIDPMVFKDDNGQLYMYMVRFTDGNTIWGRKMKSPAEFSGEPVCQFASLPDTWETMDNRVAEGPWVMKYRDRYYMMYNANHTSTEWGNYQLGVAEADSPLTFQNGGKYSYPVVLSNQTSLEENYVDVLRYGKANEPYFAYMEEQPEGNWMQPDYNASDWKKGESGFASKDVEGSTTRHLGTKWQTSSLWLRKTFQISNTIKNAALRVAHDGDTKIYLNGERIYNKQGADYCILNLSEKQIAVLRNDAPNVLAIETNKGSRTNFFDVSLFDMKDDKADDILLTPGQPNILRGPNGFEWWLIYMANKNHEPRGQYINRVQFFDKTLYVDGITGPNTKGYHPEPAKPTYGDTFDDASLLKSWTFAANDQWVVTDGELVWQNQESSYGLLDKAQSGTSYLFEAGVNATNEAGVIAYWKDAENYINVGLDSTRSGWYLQTCIQGKERKEFFNLPKDFRFGVYHTFTIEKNMDNMKVLLDGIPAPGKSWFEGILPEVEAGVPGLFVKEGKAAFDGIVYTLGFDDFDCTMPGWECISGKYESTAKGLNVSDNNKTEILKGDMLNNYEYSFQVSNLSEKGLAGGYPVYIDKDNYMKAVINGSTRTLDVTMVKNGKTLQKYSFPLECLKTIYPDVKYTDFIEKGYRFQSPVWLDALYLNRHDVGDKNDFAENMFDRFVIEYAKDGKWYPLGENSQSEIAPHPAYNKLSFSPVKTDALRFINKDPQDLSRHIDKIRINELLKTSYNIRAVKKDNNLYLFIDGKEICQLEAAYPLSKVGLYSEGCQPAYNGVLRYHIGK